MFEIEKDRITRYIILGALFLLIYLAYLTVQPFLIDVVTSAVLAYLFYPLYKKINSKLKKEGISAAIVTALVILLMLIPVGFIIINVSNEVQVGFVVMKQKLSAGSLMDIPCKGITCEWISELKDVVSDPQIIYYVENGFKRVANSIASNTVNFLLSIPKRILDFFIIVFLTFFFIKDGIDIVNFIKRDFFILRKKERTKLLREIKSTTHAIVHGLFLLALIEGILAAFIFALADVSSPMIWGIAVAIFAFVPFIGPALIWVPIFLIKLIGANYIGASIILVGGIILSFFIDTMLRAKILGKKAEIHPALILLGVLGGIKFLGFIGVIVGPLILTLVPAFVEVYAKK